jgi:GH35 family endo-1,4-beta-xylanase
MTSTNGRWGKPLAFCLAAALAAGCSSVDAPDTDVAVVRQAVTGADCGYALSAEVTKVSKKDFKAKIKIKNAAGGHLDSTGFTVLVNAGAATLDKVGHGTFQTVENGYLLSTIPADETEDDRDGDPEDPDVLGGKAYRFHLKFKGAYTTLTANLISSSGVACDQAAPSVMLTTSGDFFTAAGSLTLTATATDNVSVAKVVFAQDGVVLGTDTTAPYSLAVPVTSAINGRHRYTATAYDLTGNQASETKRVLVAIGNKFFGTATTDAADYAGLLAHFNQVTPGNAGKWGSVEATKDQMNWTDLDTAYNFAKTNHLPFKMHTLVWGQQQPTWIDSLPAADQLVQIEEWMDAVATRYPSIDLIDVVNEPLHAPPSYAAALGGAGVTGWDWVVTAFEMARRHFPNAELLLNDYSILTMASTTQDYLKIVKILSDRGLIDGIGEQGHFYERAPELSVVTSNYNALAATGLPLYITELDINSSDDAFQANRMRDLFSIFWSNPSTLGITHWGYRQGAMWQTDAYLVRTDASLRPALTWIECYKAGGTNCPVPPYTPPPRTGDASGITLQAEEYDTAQGLLPAGNVVAFANDGAYFAYNKVVFNDNWNTVAVTYANGGSGTINLTFHLGALANAPVATVPLAPTGGWGTMQTITLPWAPTGVQQALFVRFNGGGANVDNVKFTAPSGTGTNVVTDSDFEGGSTGGWFTWSTGTIANTTARAVSGTHALAMTGRTGDSPLALAVTSKVTPGKTYKVSLWATIAGAASASPHVTTALQCSGGNTAYAWLGTGAKTITAGNWVEFTGDLAVPDCALGNVQIYLEGAAAVDLFVDHVSIRQQTSSNIVPNGTFESGTSGWFTWNNGTVSSSGDRAHTGTKSLLVTNRASNAPAATDLTSLVKPGTNYPFTLWASIRTTDGSSGLVNVTLATQCQGAGANYGWVAGQTSLSGASTSFTQFSGTVAVPNCPLQMVQLFVEGAAGADLFVDDVQVVDNSGAPVNLLTDGTFESGQGGWFGWGANPISVVSTSAHGGSKSLQGVNISGGALARDIRTLVTPGKRYQATAWVSVGNVAAGSEQVRLQTVQRCNGAAGDSYPWLQGDTVANGAWKQLTGVVDLTGCSSIENLLLFSGADAGDLYIDDVVLTPLP